MQTNLQFSYCLKNSCLSVSTTSNPGIIGLAPFHILQEPHTEFYIRNYPLITYGVPLKSGNYRGNWLHHGSRSYTSQSVRILLFDSVSQNLLMHNCAALEQSFLHTNIPRILECQNCFHLWCYNCAYIQYFKDIRTPPYLALKFCVNCAEP